VGRGPSKGRAFPQPGLPSAPSNREIEDEDDDEDEKAPQGTGLPAAQVHDRL